MFRINRWDYVAPMTRKSTIWKQMDAERKKYNGEWKIERWYDEETGWCQMHTADYIGEDGKEVSASIGLFPDDFSKEEMLEYAAYGEIDIPIERYDDISREEIIEIFERQVEAMGDFTLLKEWVRGMIRYLVFPIRMKWYDFEFAVERHFKAS